MKTMLLAAYSQNITIAIAVAVAIAAGIAVYFIIRMMKGKIVIELPKNGYNSGEPVTGRVTLITKRPIQLNRFYVALVGYQILERTDKDGGRKRDKNEIYRNEMNLLEGGTIPAGSSSTFDFSLAAPGNNHSSVVSETDAKLASVIGTAVQTLGALGALGSTARRLEWKLEARADVPGVDLAKSESLRINLM